MGGGWRWKDEFPMKRCGSRVTLFVVIALLATGGALYSQQAPASGAEKEGNRADAYYNYTLGHLYAGLAESYGARGGYLQKALDYYRAALKDDPSASFITGMIAELYLQSGQVNSAIGELETAVAKNPDDLNSRRVLGRLYASRLRDAGQPQLNQEMLDKAVEQFQQVVAREPSDGDSWLWIGRLQKVANKSPEAEAAYKKALEIDPDNEDALSGLAMVYGDLGDNQHAVELMKKIAAKNPNLRTLTSLAATYEQMKEYELAAQAYEQALRLQPQNLDLKRAMANSLAMADLTDKALTVYEELAKEDSDDVQTMLRLSQLYQQKRDFDKAREYAEKASALQPDSLEIRYNEVSLLEREGREPEAITKLEEILKSTEKSHYNASDLSNRAVLIERLGSMYRNAEQFDKAEETFQSLAKLDPALKPRALAQLIEYLPFGEGIRQGGEDRRRSGRRIQG